MTPDDAALASAIADRATPLTGEPRDYDALIAAAGRVQLVLLGGATKGTHEILHARAEITKRLIAEKGYAAVAVEAGWPDAWRVNRFVRGRSRDADSLGDFVGFPRWLWRNTDVLDFVGWLREYNERDHEVGFHGFDRNAPPVPLLDPSVLQPSHEIEAWNRRDTYMTDTLDQLVRRLGPEAKVVVWAHNAHVGDARATQRGTGGQLNLGQLCRERRDGALLDGLGGTVLNVGLTTHHGTVAAASQWGGPVEHKLLRPAIEGSYEELFHAVGLDRFLLDLRMLGAIEASLEEPRFERAIGAVYSPEAERYLVACLPRQFDFVLYFDESCAVEPLERSALWEAGEPPETHPFTS
jgi:erythromycin esterase-like protein